MGTGKEAAEVSAAITVNGTTTGFITVADNSVFYAGAQAFLQSATGQQEVKIVSIGAGGLIGLRAVSRAALQAGGVSGLQAPQYGQSDMSAYTVAQAWKLYQPRQIVVIPA